MWTALATGTVCSVQSSLLGLLSQLMKLRTEPRMQVQPVYQGTIFRSELRCIVEIRLGFALLAGVKLLMRMRKSKGGIRAWQNILFKA
jgi:hypothetical protein